MVALGCLVAVSTTVLVGIEAALASVEEFRVRAAQALGGDANFEIWNGRLGVPLSVHAEALDLAAVAGAVPLDWARAEHSATGQSLLLIGVATGPGYQPIPYRLYAGDVPLGPEAVASGLFLDRERAASLALEIGETVTLQVRGQQQTLPFAGTLTAPLLAAFGGSAALVALPELSKLRGVPVVDRILLRVASTASEADVFALRRLATRYGELRRPGFGSEYATGILASAKVAVRSVLAWLLILVCVAVTSLARLLSRDSSFATTREGLQALAPGRRDLLAFGALALVSAPFLLVGVAGSAILLRVLRSGLTAPLGFFEGIGPLPVLFGSAAWLQVSLAVGAILVLALWIGVYRRPDRPGESPPGSSPMRSVLFPSLLLVAAAAGWFLRAFDPGIAPLAVGYVLGAVTLVAVIGSLAVGPERLLSRLFSLLVPKLSAGMELMRRGAPGNRVVVTAGGISLFALMTGFLVIGDSVAGSMERWVRDRLPGASVLTLGSPYARLSEDLPRIPHGWVAALRDDIRSVPDAVMVQSVASSLSFRGEEVGVSARDYAVYPARGRLGASGTTEAELRAGLRAGGVAISNTFSERFEVLPGETLSLRTHRGRRDFPVVGQVRDFAGPAGSLHFDLQHFEQHWLGAGPSGLLLWTHPGSTAIEGLAARSGSTLGRLHSEGDTAYAEFVARSGTGSRPLFGVLLGVGLVAMIALLVALVVLDVGSQAESFRLLRRLGGSPAGVAGAYVVELAIALGLAAIGGLLLGVALALPTLQLLEELLGWSVKPMLSAAPVVAVAVTAGATSAVAGTALFAAARLGFPARRPN